MSSTPLTDIASDIVKNATILSDYLTQTGHEQPSLQPGGPTDFLSDMGNDIQAARRRLIHASRQLQFLALGPTEALQWHALSGALDTATLRWLYHYEVPAAVPADQSIPFTDLAEKLKLSQRILTRVLRHAMTNNIFAEPTKGHVAHTSLSMQLAHPGNSVRGVVGHQTEVLFPAVAHMVEAHDKYGTDNDSTTRTSFNEAFGTDMRALDWIASDDAKARRFAESMQGRASNSAFSSDHVVRAFDWEGLGEAKVVDVGGADAKVTKALATAAPRLHFIVQDLPAVVAKGTAELESESLNCITFQAHDFFDANPVQQPEVFFLRQILHNWPDSDATTILQRLAANMGPKTKILINDGVMPDPGSIDPLLEKQLRNVDIMMLAMFNGLERTMEDWQELVRRADPKLRIATVTQPEGSALSLIEIIRGG